MLRSKRFESKISNAIAIAIFFALAENEDGVCELFYSLARDKRLLPILLLHFPQCADVCSHGGDCGFFDEPAHGSVYGSEYGLADEQTYRGNYLPEETLPCQYS